MNNILVPFDFSANAIKALEFAIALSKNLNAGIVAYHCLPKPVAADEQSHKQHELLSSVEQAYKKAGYEHIPSATVIITQFNPFMEESIIEQAQKEKAGLIVMGTRGSSGLQKFFLGSVTSNIISKSEIPVLAIPEQYNGGQLQQVVYSSDLENLPAELDALLPYLYLIKGKLQIVHFDYGIHPDTRYLRDAQLVVDESGIPNAELITQPATIEQPLNTQIKKYLAGSNADCLIMFTKERSLWDRLFKGSKTVDLSENLHIPLLSFKLPKRENIF